MADADALAGLDEELDRLYGGPPEEFTAERDRLAKALRTDGEKDRAAAVGRLRRPTRLAAALNAIARADPTGLGRLIEASSALAEAQEDVLKGRGDAAGLRDAERAEREALEPLIAGAGEDGPALAAALRAGARSPAGREPLRRGWLSREPEPDAGGLFAMGAPIGAPPKAPSTPAKAAPEPASEPEPEPEPEEPPDPETPAKLERAKEALDAARAAAEEAEGEHARAEAAAGEAAEARRTAEEARDAARAAAEESAKRAAEDAERAEAAAREADAASERADAEDAGARAAAERRDAARRALEGAEAAAREAIAAAEGRRPRAN